MRANIGSGDHNAEDWLNVDRYDGPGAHPDLVADAFQLPFRDASVDAVYAGHLIEHLTYEVELPAFLRECRRVLAPNGRACFVAPDYDKALANPEWHVLLPGIISGGQRWPGDEHQWVGSAWMALIPIREAFPTAHEVDIAAVDHFWPVVNRDDWQFAIEVT